MKPKFKWSTDKIKFYKEASYYTGFFDKIGDIISPYLNKDDKLADVGCGIGILSFVVAPKVKSVQAIDINKDVIADLKEEMKTLENLNGDTAQYAHRVIPIEKDVEDMTDEEWDIVLMSFYGFPGSDLSSLLQRAKRYSFIIINDANPDDRLNESSKELKRVFAPDIENFLKREGFKYDKGIYDLDFGQPLRSIREARLFNGMYSKGMNPVEEEQNFLKMKNDLVKTNNDQFPYYLPKEKKVAVFRVESREFQ